MCTYAICDVNANAILPRPYSTLSLHNERTVFHQQCRYNTPAADLKVPLLFYLYLMLHVDTEASYIITSKQYTQYYVIGGHCIGGSYTARLEHKTSGQQRL